MKRRIQTTLKIKLEEPSEMRILTSYIEQRLNGQMNSPLHGNKPANLVLRYHWDGYPGTRVIDFCYHYFISPCFRIKEIIYEEKN